MSNGSLLFDISGLRKGPEGMEEFLRCVKRKFNEQVRESEISCLFRYKSPIASDSSTAYLYD